MLEIPPSQFASSTVWLDVDKNKHGISLGMFYLMRGCLPLLLFLLESGFSEGGYATPLVASRARDHSEVVVIFPVAASL